MSSLTVGTYNTLHSLSAEVFKRDLYNLTHTTSVDLLGLQEVHGPGRDAVMENLDGWTAYRPGWAGSQRQTPVMWRTSAFEMVGYGTELLARGVFTLPDRWGNWCELLHKPTRRTVYLLNSHAHPHIERAGHPRSLPRTREAEAHFAALVTAARYFGTQGEVFVTGDFNVDYVADRRVRYPRFPYTTFANAHLIPCWRGASRVVGTHGNRTIDYVYHRRSGHVTFEHVKVLDGYHSDHKPVLATYNVTA